MLTLRAAATHPLTDVGGPVSLAFGKPRRRGPRRMVQKVTLVDRAARAIYGPFYLILGALAPRIKLHKKAGTTRAQAPGGSPYVSVALGRLNPAQRVTIALDFRNVRGRRLRYAPRLLAGTGRL